MLCAVDERALVRRLGRQPVAAVRLRPGRRSRALPGRRRGARVRRLFDAVENGGGSRSMWIRPAMFGTERLRQSVSARRVRGVGRGGRAGGSIFRII